MGHRGLNKLIEEVECCALKIDKYGKVIECSGDIEYILEYSESDLIGYSVHEIMDETLDEVKLSTLRQVLGIGGVLIRQCRLRTATHKVVEVTGKYVLEGLSDIKLTFIDLEKRTRIREEVLMECLDLLVCIINQEQEILYISPKLEYAMAKKGRYGLRHRKFSVFSSVFVTTLEQMLRDGVTATSFEHYASDGNISEWVRVHFKLASDGLVIMYIEDIQAEKVNRDIIETSQRGVVIESKEGICRINAKARKLLGINEEQIATDTKLVELIDTDYKMSFLEAFSRYPLEKQKEDVHCYIKTKEGFPVLMTREFERFKLQGQSMSIYFLRDIMDEEGTSMYHDHWQTAAKQITERLEYEHIKTEFLANMSHELRTPINIIFSAIQLLRTNVEYLDRNTIKYIDIINQNCCRLIRLVNNLLHITKIDTGYIDLKLKNYDIIYLIEEIVLSVKTYVEHKGLSLVFDTEIEELVMACDSSMMESILLNLLANATKFTKQGGAIMVDLKKGHNSLIIEVSDTGVGIPQDRHQEIFKRFKQVDKSFQRAHEGSGIGLALVKSFVELQGGTILVESEEGVGSKFTIEMPIQLVEHTYEVEEPIYEAENVGVRVNIEFADIY